MFLVNISHLQIIRVILLVLLSTSSPSIVVRSSTFDITHYWVRFVAREHEEVLVMCLVDGVGFVACSTVSRKIVPRDKHVRIFIAQAVNTHYVIQELGEAFVAWGKLFSGSTRSIVR